MSSARAAGKRLRDASSYIVNEASSTTHAATIAVQIGSDGPPLNPDENAASSVATPPRRRLSYSYSMGKYLPHKVSRRCGVFDAL